MSDSVGLVTYHNSTSYGACLQAFATQECIKKLGYNVKIINYTNRYEQRIKKVFFSADGTIKSAIKNGIKSLVFRRNYWLRKAFSDFSNNYNLTDVSYTSADDMKELVFDMLVVGSDQVWSPKISGSIDEVFLLQFGRATKRISFASSFGSYKLTRNDESIFYDALNKFYAISVREKFAASQLNNIGIRNASVVCDPTLTLSSTEWKGFMKEYKKTGYILTYFVSGSFSEFRDDVETIKKARGLNYPIFNIQSSNFHWNGVDETLVGVSPEKFLGIINGADLIITDSFHGTVFSLLFHKQFVVINNKTNPVRINELLDNVSLSRCNYHRSQPVDVITDEDFSIADEAIKLMRERSVSWLKDALNG